METSDWQEVTFGTGRFVWSDSTDDQHGRLILEKGTHFVYQPYPKEWFKILRQSNIQLNDAEARNVFNGMLATWSGITTEARETHEAADTVMEQIEEFASEVPQSLSLSTDELFTLVTRFYGLNHDAYRMKGQLIGGAQDLEKHKRNALAGTFAFVLDEIEGMKTIEAKAHGIHAFRADHESSLTTYESLSEVSEDVVGRLERTLETPQIPTVRRAPDN